jgi:hypothetical protein
MTFRSIKEDELAAFAEHVRDLLDTGALESIDPSVRAAISAAIGTLPDSFRTRSASSMVREFERKTEVSSKNDDKTALKTLMAQVRDSLKASRASDEEYALSGYELPRQRSPYVAQDPTALSVEGFSNGTNKLRFTGNNRAAQVIYEIWRRTGADGGWAIHATTRKQSFMDEGVTPGVRYEYRVRAVAAKTASELSNTAVVGSKL